jgi:hypothetical protein
MSELSHVSCGEVTRRPAKALLTQLNAPFKIFSDFQGLKKTEKRKSKKMRERLHAKNPP